MLKINIVRGTKDQDPVTREISFTEARKAINGDLMIFDHDLIDIVISREKLKVSTFPKEVISEETYHVQESLLSTLARFGIVDRGSIKAGSVHSSLEGQILKSIEDDVSSFQLTLLEVYNFLQNEEPNMKSRSMYKDTLQNFFLDPKDEDSTELGEVPQKDRKGSMDNRVRPYGYQYMYSILREMLER
jgi:hypothetical protein